MFLNNIYSEDEIADWFLGSIPYDDDRKKNFFKSSLTEIPFPKPILGFF